MDKVAIITGCYQDIIASWNVWCSPHFGSSTSSIIKGVEHSDVQFSRVEALSDHHNAQAEDASCSGRETSGTSYFISRSSPKNLALTYDRYSCNK